MSRLVGEKEACIIKYKNWKELNDGRKPRYSEFLIYAKLNKRKLAELFGSNAFAKLQRECGDNPNKFFQERTPLTQILAQYGQLVRSLKIPPKTSDWIYAKYKPTTDAINRIHGLKWGAMPEAFIEAFGDQVNWKDVTDILRTLGTQQIQLAKKTKQFDEIVDKISVWSPDRKRVIEEGYKIELRNYLEKYFELEEEVGESNPDLLINKKHPIEVKKDPTQSEYDRLLGQMIRHCKTYGNAIAVIIGVSSTDRLKKFIRLFNEVRDKLNFSAEIIQK